VEFLKVPGDYYKLLPALEKNRAIINGNFCLYNFYCLGFQTKNKFDNDSAHF